MNRIKKIYIKDLNSFINSNEYKNMPHLPISVHRAKSYIKNHRAEKNDVAIYILYIKNEIIGYRTIFSDCIFINDIKYKIYWTSGSWVKPEQRRKGYSIQMLNKIVEDLQDNIFFSNFAPNAKAVFDKSKHFEKIKSLKGKRFYFRFSSHQILPKKIEIFKKIKYALKIIDKSFNFFINIKSKFGTNKINNINFVFIKDIDNELYDFILNKNKNNPFKRNISEFNHFQKFPWVINAPFIDNFNMKYYFSSISKNFCYNNIKIYNSNNVISAFFIIKIRNKNIEIPYIFYEKNEINNIYCILKEIIRRNKIFTITLFDKNLLEIFNKKSAYLFSKQFNKNFYASKKISKLFENKNFEFYSGDGDNAYT